MSALKPGDKVKLVSGGPAMTIASIKDGVARVCWFAHTRLRVETFPLVILKPTCSPALRASIDKQLTKKKRTKK